MTCASPQFRRRGAGWLAAAALLAVAGCGGPKYAEVRGAVTRAGVPLDGVQVVFMPDPERGTTGPPATGYTDTEGRYRLRCERAGTDGAVVGLYRVCLYDLTALPDPVVAETANKPDPPDRLLPLSKKSRVPPAYGHPNETPLRVEVQPRAQVIDLDVK